ncbi:hypothetical protein [Streptomyces sp. ISL-36]|nr:hypothetical protein [Streptomyces sp. ISL-36]
MIRPNGLAYIPPLLYGALAGAVVVLGLASTGVPARAALRRP